MLTVNPAQLKSFEDAAMARFRHQMADHARAVAPRLCATLDAAQLATAVNAVVDRALRQGFTNRGPVRLFVELACLFGSGFETDPLHPAITELLAAPEDQMVRADRLHRLYLAHVAHTCGDDDATEARMLARLGACLRQPPMADDRDPSVALVSEMHRLWPEKAELAGLDALAALSLWGWVHAGRRGLGSPRGRAVAVLLMFVLGHACLDDPLYPWIARSLQDVEAQRDATLARQAHAWSQQMLAPVAPAAPAGPGGVA